MLIDTLHQKLSPTLETEHFKKTLGILIWLDPIALGTQLWAVIISDNVEAISIPMLAIFILIQTVLILQAIRTRNSAMFFALGLSALESMAIIAVVLCK